MVTDAMLIEDIGSTVADQTAINNQRNRLAIIRQIMEARLQMGATQDLIIFDKLCDMKIGELKRAADHYIGELLRYKDNVGKRNRFKLSDV